MKDHILPEKKLGIYQITLKDFRNILFVDKKKTTLETKRKEQFGIYKKYQHWDRETQNGLKTKQELIKWENILLYIYIYIYIYTTQNKGKKSENSYQKLKRSQ